MDIQKHHEEMLAALPLDIVTRAVRVLRNMWVADPATCQVIRYSWNEDPATWWITYHHGWGTAIRNRLRDDVCKDEMLPSQSWDDYYVALVEISCGLRKMPTVSDPLREELADYAHSAWSGWMKYMFGKSIRVINGWVIIPADLVERWTRQMNTPYAELPESEKESDRAEADKMLELFKGNSDA